MIKWWLEQPPQVGRTCRQEGARRADTVAPGRKNDDQKSDDQKSDDHMVGGDHRRLGAGGARRADPVAPGGKK